MAQEKILEVKDLTINFKTDAGLVQAVRGVSFDLSRGETLCIVGESGSGKSVTSKAIMGILAGNAIVENGSIMYEGENLLEVSEDEFYKIRGHKIGMIFQDPLSSLNPIVRIGKQITEAMLINSNKLKNMYDDLISRELIAYKNAIAKCNIYVNREKKNLEEKLSELKAKIGYKNSDLIKAEIQKITLETNEKVSKIKAEIDAKLAKLEEEKNSNLIKAEIQKITLEANEEVSKIKAETNVELAELKAKLKEEKNSELIKAEIQKITLEANEEVSKIKVETDAKLTELKNNLLDAKVEDDKNNESIKAEIQKITLETKEKVSKIKAETDAKLPELKAKLDAKKAEAKAEVSNYKTKVHTEYLEKVAAIKKEYQNASSKEEKENKKAALVAAKSEYVDKTRITKAAAKKKALELMKEVGIPLPEKRFRQYPFEFSGGMRQRIVIAIALTATPEILICDEPTTALDVTIQAQILELIKRIQKERNIACIFITHDLGVVANMADRVAVMYAGEIVEHGTSEEIFFDPRHPYTWALLSSIPDVDSKERLEAIPGTPPNMIYPPKGDAFALRSKYAMNIDFEHNPPFFKISDTHYAKTWLLHPDAPKVEMPKIVSERIKKALSAKEGSSNE